MNQGILRSALSTSQRLELNYRRPAGYPTAGDASRQPAAAQDRRAETQNKR